MKALIALMGNTGAGKTSLANALRAAHPFAAGLEEHQQRPFQSLFKQNPRYALANQVDYLLLRAEQERSLRGGTLPALLDGGLEQDFHIFTRLFYTRGYLSREEFALCRRLYENIRANQPAPELFIYLRLEEEKIRLRLQKRQRINIATLQDLPTLETYLQEWADSLPPKNVLRLDVNQASPDYNQVIPAILAAAEQWL
jgi:deoxyadenosine/deoxycytidine kinase